MFRTERTEKPEVSERWCGVVRVVKAAATCRLRAAGLQSPAGSPAAAILLTSLYLPAQPSTPRHLLSRQLGATYNNTIPHQHLLQIQIIGAKIFGQEWVQEVLSKKWQVACSRILIFLSAASLKVVKKVISDWVQSSSVTSNTFYGEGRRLKMCLFLSQSQASHTLEFKYW